MSERKTGTSNFSFAMFFCPKGYEEIAKVALGELKIRVSPETQPAQRTAPTGKVLNGTIIHFACPNEQLPKATETLKKAGVPGCDKINNMPLKPHIPVTRFSTQ